MKNLLFRWNLLRCRKNMKTELSMFDGQMYVLLSGIVWIVSWKYFTKK